MDQTTKRRYLKLFGERQCLYCGKTLNPFYENGSPRPLTYWYCDQSCLAKDKNRHRRDGTIIRRVHKVSHPCFECGAPTTRPYTCSVKCSTSYAHKHSDAAKARLRAHNLKNSKEGWGFWKAYKEMPESERAKYYQEFKRKVIEGRYKDKSGKLGSKAELEFYKVLKSAYPSIRIIHHETTVVPGYEFDFSFPDFRLLVEWNGPAHYSAEYYAYKNTAVKPLMHRRMIDEYKNRKARELGWKVITVLDDSYYKDGAKLKDIIVKVLDRITYHISKEISLSAIYMSTAKEYAALSTCTRLSVGAVIVRNGRIVSTGTNGSPVGQPHCKDVGCLLDERGRCVRTVHAEENAILSCNDNGIPTDGTILYCTHMPCISCLKSIVQAGISVICFEHDYDDGMNKVLARTIKHVSFFQLIDGEFKKIDI